MSVTLAFILGISCGAIGAVVALAWAQICRMNDE